MDVFADFGGGAYEAEAASWRQSARDLGRLEFVAEGRVCRVHCQVGVGCADQAVGVLDEHFLVYLWEQANN